MLVKIGKVFRLLSPSLAVLAGIPTLGRMMAISPLFRATGVMIRTSSTTTTTILTRIIIIESLTVANGCGYLLVHAGFNSSLRLLPFLQMCCFQRSWTWSFYWRLRNIRWFTTRRRLSMIILIVWRQLWKHIAVPFLMWLNTMIIPPPFPLLLFLFIIIADPNARLNRFIIVIITLLGFPLTRRIIILPVPVFPGPGFYGSPLIVTAASITDITIII